MKSVYENPKLKKAINHLFPVERGEFFYCQETGKTAKYDYTRKEWRC